jgi:hypothetical protein
MVTVKAPLQVPKLTDDVKGEFLLLQNHCPDVFKKLTKDAGALMLLYNQLSALSG